jgi:hypothetical protein
MIVERAAQHSSARAPRPARASGPAGALLLALLTALSSGACAAPRETTDLPEDPLEALSDLAWLAGDWRRLDSTLPRGERWWYDGQELVGEAWVRDRGRRLVTERLAIRVVADEVVYEADLVGRDQPITRFALVELARRAVAFENPEHGHPWRLAYVDGAAGMEVSLFFRDAPDEPSRVERQRFVRNR